MEEKLIRLKDRLNDLSRRNRSLRLLKLPSRWTFDLTEMDENEKAADSPAAKLLNTVIYKKRRKLRLTHSRMSENKLQKIGNNLTHLYRTMRAIEEETGVYDLYIGYPFLTGNLRDGSFIQAPLFLYPVRLVRKDRGNLRWELEYFSYAEPHLNRTLFLALKRFHRVTIPEKMMEEVEGWKPEQRESLKAWAEWFEKNEIPVKSTKKRKLQPFSVYTRNTVPKKAPLTLERFAILGNFPQGNSSLIADYEELIQMAKTEELPNLSQLIELEDNLPNEEVEKEAPTRKPKEEEQFYLLPTDASQEEFLQQAKMSKGMVLHGPPGTGKSQVIVNMITDALAKGKRILVVCQKRAALDVVYQRLEGLGFAPFVALIHDEKQDRKRLYHKIHTQIPKRSLAVADQETSFRKLCKRLEEREQKLNQIYRGLHERGPFGFSAYELYGRAQKRDKEISLIPVSDLAGEVDRDNLDDLLTIISLYASYHQRFEKEDYPLRNRKSFAQLKIKDQAELLEKLDLTLEKATKAEELINQLGDKQITPSYLWQVNRKLAKIYNHLHSSKRGAFAKFRLWWWTTFTGRKILRKLLQGEKFQGISSAQWDQLQQSLRFMYELSQITLQLDLHLEVLLSILQLSSYLTLRKEFLDGKIPRKSLSQIREAIQHDFDDLRAMDRCYEEASPKLQKLIQRLQSKDWNDTEKLSAQWTETARQSFYYHWIDELERKHPYLTKVSSNEYEQLRNDFAQVISEKRSLAKQVLLGRIHEQINQSIQSNQRSLKELKYQTGKQRMVWPVRKLIDHFAEKGLFDVIPVWLASPETVSSIFPLRSGMFDLVIFDEASQCTVESGLPTIFRGKQVVVAGDEKQLQPFEQFRVALYNDEEEETEFEMEESRSLLNLTKRIYPEHMLQYHYRSKFEELIHFSNHAFYHGSMQIAPNITSEQEKPAIHWKRVDGRWINQCNEQEALAVVDLIAEHLKKRPQKTLGVITFNAKQQEKIWQVLEKRIKEDAHFSALYDEMMSKDLDERIFIKNIENVQGDERDIIIFSIGYAPNEEGRMYHRFGLLNQQGGENRLNVAVTRAKERIDIVVSIEPHELNVAGSTHEGPKLFRHYLEYAKAISEGKREQALTLLERINPYKETNKQFHDDRFDSPLEMEICEALRNCGYQVDTQIGVSGYRIDLGIVHPEDPGRYILGIECDGATYHSSPNAKERDLYRQEFLEARGWTIERIWSRNWWRNPEAEIEKIDRRVKGLMMYEEYLQEVKSGNH